MAHTNQTAHYHLPQYVGTDIINPLTDTNKAYEDIDTALYEQGQSVAGVVDDINALKIQNGNSALDTTAQTLSGAVNELKSGADALGLRVTANETDISTLQTQMSTATGNITTLNTSVAGLQTEVASKASATALDNLTTKVGTGNLDTVAQNCVAAINEVNAKIPQGGSVEADDVVYDNTDSGLTATNVQDAIDELAEGTAITIVNPETKIGTFLGKDLYRKVVSANNPTSGYAIDSVLTSAYVDDLVSVNGYIDINGDKAPITFAHVTTGAGANTSSISVMVATNGLLFYVQGVTATKAVVVVEYTKA